MNIYDDMLYDNSLNIMPTNTNTFNPYEAYMKGNLFKDLYKDYKDYKPMKLIPNNEEAELLLNIGELCFINQDRRLYLDMYPNDREMLEKYNNDANRIKDLIKRYEDSYGPLTYTSPNKNIFTWAITSFPWEEVNR